MESHRKAIRVALILGAIIFPLLALLDLAVYPSFLKELWTIRVCITLLLVANLFILKKVKAQYLFIYAFVLFILASFAVSLMCFVTGDGFASPYYAGQFISLIIATVFFPMTRNYYLAIASGCVFQHFVLLSFIPWYLKDLMINICFLGSVIFSGWIVRRFISKLISEIKTLKGFIPICAKCKKIRDNKGYWNQLEKYITERSEVDFTHSYCPECAKELREEIDNYDNNNT